jgi:hypothetical protein
MVSTIRSVRVDICTVICGIRTRIRKNADITFKYLLQHHFLLFAFAQLLRLLSAIRKR